MNENVNEHERETTALARAESAHAIHLFSAARRNQKKQLFRGEMSAFVKMQLTLNTSAPLLSMHLVNVMLSALTV